MTKRRALSIAAIVTLYAAWAASYIHRTSFVVENERYFVLFDDAMISMRYARHLAQGQGLVWNIGEPPIEGFSNPLWTLFMAGVQVLPVPLRLVSGFVQVAGAVCVLVASILVWQQARTHVTTLAAMVATVWTLFYLPLNTWSLQGMEVGLLTVLLLAATLAQARALDAGRFSVWPYVWLTVATFVRMDAAAFMAATTICLAVIDRARRRQHLKVGFGLLACALGMQTALRLAYFGEWLPNTYYLKLTGFPLGLRLIRGAATLMSLVTRQVPIFIAAIIAFLLQPTPLHALYITLVTTATIYTVYTGGDAWEWWGGANRYMTPVMPFVLILAATHMSRLHESLRTARMAFVTPVVGAVACLVLLHLNTVNGRYPFAEFFLLVKPMSTDGVQGMVRRAVVLDRVLTQDARVAVLAAGSLPFFLERPIIDQLGKNDAHIAHLSVAVTRPGIQRYDAFLPGHNKGDAAYAIGRQKPDAIVQMWMGESDDRGVLRDYLEWHVGDWVMLLRKDSRAVRWDLVRQQGDVRPTSLRTVTR